MTPVVRSSRFAGRQRRLGSSRLPLAGLFACIWVVAFALRAVFVWNNHSNLGLGQDSLWYSLVAGEIAHGKPIRFLVLEHVGARVHVMPILTAAHGILFPLIVAAGEKLGATSFTATRLVGGGLGSCAAIAIGVLAHELAGRRVGLCAAVLAAIYPPFILNDALLMSEPLYRLLVVLAVLAALRMRHRSPPAAAVAFGVIVGLAALTRTEGSLLLLFLGVPLLWRVGHAWRRLGVALVAALVVVSPWVVRNWSVFGSPTLSTGSGSVLVAANCQQTYYGPLLGGWFNPCLTAAAKQVNPNEAQQSHRWSVDGIDYAEAHLSRVPEVMVARVLRTFNLYPFDIGRQGHDAQEVTGGSVAFNQLCVWAGLALLVAAALGCRFTNREARRALVPLIALVVVLVAATESAPRLRESADVALLIFAAHGLIGLAGGRRRRITECV